MEAYGVSGSRGSTGSRWAHAEWWEAVAEVGYKGLRSIYGTLGNFVRLRRRLLVGTLTREWELPSDLYELWNWPDLVVQPRDDWPPTRPAALLPVHPNRLM